MVIKEFCEIRADGVFLYITKSDNGVKIRKVGTDEVYDSAIDVENCFFIYEETDIPIDVIEENEETL